MRQVEIVKAYGIKAYQMSFEDIDHAIEFLCNADEAILEFPYRFIVRFIQNLHLGKTLEIRNRN